MALRLGSSEKLKINANNVKHSFIVPNIIALIDGVMLLDKQSYILKDLNGLYLLEKESE